MLEFLQATAASAAEHFDNVPFALSHGLLVYRHRSNVYTVIRCTARKVCHPCAANHGFCRGTTHGDACATNQIRTLENGCLPTGFGQRPGERLATLPRPDDERVEMFG